VCVVVAAGHGLWLWHGLRLGHGLWLRQGGVWAFALGDGAGLGAVEYAAIGEGLWCLACDLAANGCIFAGANLRLGRSGGPQAQCNEGAVQKDAKAG
jgi:hypothetical protein